LAGLAIAQGLQSAYINYDRFGGGIPGIFGGAIAGATAGGATMFGAGSGVTAVGRMALSSGAISYVNNGSASFNVGVGTWNTGQGSFGWHDFSGGIMSDIGTITGGAAVADDIKKLEYGALATDYEKQLESGMASKCPSARNQPAYLEQHSVDLSADKEYAEFMSDHIDGSRVSQNGPLAKYVKGTGDHSKDYAQIRTLGGWHSAYDAINGVVTPTLHFDRISATAWGGLGFIPHTFFETRWSWFGPAQSGFNVAAMTAYSGRGLWKLR